MTTNEFCYLILVIGGFGSFALALFVATFQYQGSKRHPEVVRVHLRAKAAIPRSH